MAIFTICLASTRVVRMEGIVVEDKSLGVELLTIVVVCRIVNMSD